MASLDFEKEKALFREYYSENQRLLMDAEVFFRSLVGSLLSISPTITTPTITGRVKDREESIKKFVRKYQSDFETAKIPYEIKDHITDLIAIRVICLYEDEVGDIAKVLTDNFDVLEVTDKIKALESTEDEFGYKGLHLDIKINGKRRELPEYRRFSPLRFEVQIRTIVQDAWSVLDHKIKYKKSIPPRLKRRINALAAQFETVDHEFLAIKNESIFLEKQATTTSAKTPETQKLPLNVFEFLAIAKEHFNVYVFSTEFVDGFVQEILQRHPQHTNAEFSAAVKSLKGQVDRYKNQSSYAMNMNPYTIMRHILVLSDSEKFKLMLFDLQRNNFFVWLANNKPLDKSIIAEDIRKKPSRP
jgi:ppGpp synthetase/RelA/SpoT-type nucleotidyltranferase